MSGCTHFCPSAICSRFMLLALLLIVFLVCGSASAQMGSIDMAQSDLVKKPAAEQAAILAEVVRGAWEGRSCTSPKVSLEKTYNDGGGGWLVLCNEGQTTGLSCLIGQSLRLRCSPAFWRASPVLIAMQICGRLCQRTSSNALRPRARSIA
jgi:hypothetical protein